jgi:hypothetical protein
LTDTTPSTSSVGSSLHYLAPPSPSAQTAIRKSLSVDSFIAHRRSSDTHRANSHATQSGSAGPSRSTAQPSRRTSTSASATSWPDRDRALGGGHTHHKGNSLAPMREGAEELSRAPHRITRAAGPKPGQLILPARQPINSATTPRRPDLGSSTSLGNADALRIVVSTGISRERSGSEASEASGTSLSTASSAMVSFTRLYAFVSPSDALLRQYWKDERPFFRPEVRIAVIGEKTCGKSTAVRKGLKGYALSEPSRISISQLTDIPGPLVCA